VRQGRGARGPASTGTPKAITIRQGKDGSTIVDGPPLRGDPKACAALRRCCAAPDLSLTCGLAQASENGDCTKALAAVKAYARESRSPGCED
jgi:hypothetical protein